MNSESSDQKRVEPPRVALPGVRVVASDDLFEGAKEVIIIHGNEHYRLRVTRSGKLILQK